MLRRGFLYSLNNNTAAPYEAETIAYQTATGIVNGTTYGTKTGLQLIQAVDRFVKDIKGITNPGYATSDLIGDMRCIHPCLGGTAATNAIDLLAAYDWVFSGTPTQDYIGWSRNGSTQNATFGALTGDQISSFFIFIASNVEEAVIDFDFSSGGKAKLYARYPTNICYTDVLAANGDELSYTNTNSIGLYGGVRGSSTTISGWKDGVKKIEDTSAPEIQPTGGGVQYTTGATKKIGFDALFKNGTYLSDTQVVNLMTAINALLVATGKI